MIGLDYRISNWTSKFLFNLCYVIMHTVVEYFASVLVFYSLSHNYVFNISVLMWMSKIIYENESFPPVISNI